MPADSFSMQGFLVLYFRADERSSVGGHSDESVLRATSSAQGSCTDSEN